MAERRGPLPPELDEAPQGGQAVVEETSTRVEKPRLYKVLLHNDNYTTMEFVVMVLMSVFHLEEAKAVEVMLAVHQEGVGVAGTYTFEVAEAKAAKAMRMAREAEFPLRCSVEVD